MTSERQRPRPSLHVLAFSAIALLCLLQPESLFRLLGAQTPLLYYPSRETTLTTELKNEQFLPTRILFSITSYDKGQQIHLHAMLDSIADICSASEAMVIDVIIYTVIPNNHPDPLLDKHFCGQVEVRIKDPSVNVHLSGFHRNELFYQELENYDLFVYSEDDMLIRPRHVFGFWRETTRLKEAIGTEASNDYSIGFLRFEVNQTKEQGEIPEKIVWEHYWDTSSHETFAKEHIFRVTRGTDQLYFTGASKTPQTHEGNHHQAMYMATREQLVAWQGRPPNCRFNDTTFLGNQQKREKVSSMHLFEKTGCNVTQLIPVDGFQDFLVHHLPNKQAPVLWRYLPRGYELKSLSALELGSWLRRSANHTTVYK